MITKEGQGLNLNYGATRCCQHYRWHLPKNKSHSAFLAVQKQYKLDPSFWGKPLRTQKKILFSLFGWMNYPEAPSVFLFLNMHTIKCYNEINYGFSGLPENTKKFIVNEKNRSHTRKWRNIIWPDLLFWQLNKSTLKTFLLLLFELHHTTWKILFYFLIN